MALLSTTTISKYFIDRLINEDIEACLDYNKIYLKECEYVSNNGFNISKCNNPSEEKLKELEDSNISYGLNYDYVLNHLYNREDLFVINNNKVTLSQGEYPKNIHQVIASNKYKLGETLTLQASIVLREKEVDVYMESLSLEVVGIYKELKFIKEDVIFFDYKKVDQYFKDTILKNNNISIYEYYNNLEIKNYKYISFYDLNLKSIEGDNVKYEFYKGIKDVVSKIENLLDYLDLFIIIFGWYIVFKLNKIKLLEKQRSNVFMLTNSISKRAIINSYLIYDAIITTIIIFGVGLITFLITQNLTCLKRYILFLISIIMIFYFQSLKFLSRKKISQLIGEEA